MFPDLSKMFMNTATDVPHVAPDACNGLGCSDYASFRDEMLSVNEPNTGHDVFYNRGPRGEHFYGSATLEQLNNVHIHYDGEL